MTLTTLGTIEKFEIQTYKKTGGTRRTMCHFPALPENTPGTLQELF